MTNSNAIEVLSKATHVVFDKTGTLTSGLPTIQSVNILHGDYSEDECLRIATALEQASTHPLAHAFRSDHELPVVSEAEVHVAEGVGGVIDNTRWRLGRASFAAADFDSIDASGTVVYLSSESVPIARFTISDALRPDALDSLNSLKNLGINLSLVSGDNEGAVRAVADFLQIDDVHFDCTPEDKLAIIEALQASGERVVMVGDGINDAPVLAGADTSIAPGHGALLAQTSADVIMLGNSLRPVTTALRLSKATMRIVRQNLVWAVVYNATALPLAVAGMVPPWLAAIGMSASSLVVVVNALRLNRYA